MAKYQFIPVSEISARFGWSADEVYQLAAHWAWSSQRKASNRFRVEYRQDQVERTAWAQTQIPEGNQPT